MDGEPRPAGEEGSDRDYRVNFFRPRRGYMRQVVTGIWIMLILWGGLTIGFQLLLVGFQRNPAGEGPLTDLRILGFPFHVWFSAQFLILCFIILCFIFNLYVDRMAGKYRKRR